MWAKEKLQWKKTENINVKEKLKYPLSKSQQFASNKILFFIKKTKCISKCSLWCW